MRVACLVLFFCLSVIAARAQQSYVCYEDTAHAGGKIMVGALRLQILENEPSFHWFRPAYTSYLPDTALLTALEKGKDRYHLLVFGGTWCDDSQYILPRLFKLLRLSGFPDARVNFWGVDRNKKVPGGLCEALDIQRVPTLILFKDGREAGRVVEYGITGKWDAELAGWIR